MVISGASKTSQQPVSPHRSAAKESPAMELLRRLAKPLDQFRVVVFCALATLFFLLVLWPISRGNRGGLGGSRAWAPAVEIVARRGGGGDAGGECDLFEGEWVWDESYPLYESRDCPFLDEGFRCSENGRPDRNYTKWRWQPRGCRLPRFDAKKMLKRLRNKRLVFVGDSIGRNQWESLLCMLSNAVPNKGSIYEVNGSPITKHRGFLVFKFRDYNCTVEYYRSPFLVVQGRAPAGVPDKVKTTLKLDTMDWMSTQWKDADVLVFNTGHWWNYEKTIRAGCYFQEGSKVHMEMTVENAYQRSIATFFDWVHKEVNTNKSQVFFRSYAPVHFRDGNWNTGGNCHLEKLPELSSLPLSLKPWANFLKPLQNVTLQCLIDSQRPGVILLNVTQMTARRKDGHLSVYYNGPQIHTPLHKQDCSHWCLPGVPDSWNEVLYSFIKRRYSIIHENYHDHSKSRAG